mmetsp:Transcript_68846/g.155995  ORF Transcript_68846/g.155995 Transcript_68846/m.155995 type:complete len:388 (-) Transcript_68846:142-1305(-)
MGCCSSSDGKGRGKDVSVEQGRRRLSVGTTDQEDRSSNEEVSEADRGLLTSLEQRDIVAMIEHDGGGGENGRKMSIGSVTDQGKTSFANKTVHSYGDKLDPKTYGIGHTCRKGLKPEAPNQDSWLVLKVESNYSIYAVFDGHGVKGHDVSNFVKENLPKMIIKDQRFKTDQMPQMLKDSFKQIQSLVKTRDGMSKLEAKMSGTTATVVIHDMQGNQLTVAHVADSTAVLGILEGSEVSAEVLTRDHKPNLPDERSRIEANGGRVVFDGYANHRVYAKNARYPGLNMSRCIGDLLGHQDCGITAEPEVSQTEVLAKHHVLLVCSDGVWEFISPHEAVQMVVMFGAGRSMAAADNLAKTAWDRWIEEEGGQVVDDITVVLAFLNQEKSG